MFYDCRQFSVNDPCGLFVVLISVVGFVGSCPRQQLKVHATHTSAS
jgi:hypothetical protein